MSEPKVVILAGGLGTRLSEETEIRPKPMIEIGGRPILWHIMKIYSTYGFNEFIICLGYKGYVIKEYFANYFLHQSDITIDIANNKVAVHKTFSEPWRITLVETGAQTMTGGRLKKIQSYVQNETFFLTYGDGVGDINIRELLAFHRRQGKPATLTAIQPVGRFGALEINAGNEIVRFHEKPQGDGMFVNGGFFVLEPAVFKYIEGDDTVWERDPLEKLAHAGQLSAYKHTKFWMCVDTLRDKKELENYWNTQRAPWKIWPDQP
ncbi:MAG: glucose-1-phosphate cytidylyltransferase [Candidatus Omnitrophica bacterium]|nr:glucose-1-phosphate cytidylyltransferase [Candidatus Omnitrophota bacterium]